MSNFMLTVGHDDYGLLKYIFCFVLTLKVLFFFPGGEE